MQYPPKDTPTPTEPEGTESVNQPHKPRALASEVTPEQVAIYQVEGKAPESGKPNPHNVTKSDIPPLDDSREVITDQPEEFDPRMLGAAEPGPLELPPTDAGILAREKAKGRSFKAKVRRAWNWTKAIILLLLLLAGAFLYWQYTVRKHTYVVEPRICFFETADKSIRLTGTRYYSYTQNEMLGYRWAHTDDVSVKTEIDVKGDSMVITGLGGPDGPTSKYVPQGERGVQVLTPATTYVVTLDKRSVVLESNKFCR